MSLKRSAVQAVAVLAWLGGHVALAPLVAPAAAQAVRADAPVPAQNALTNLVVRRSPEGGWVASVDYAFTGRPFPTRITMYQQAGFPDGDIPYADRLVGELDAKAGSGTFTVNLPNPSYGGDFVTRRVWAAMESQGQKVTTIVSDQRIVWRDPLTDEVDRALAAGETDRILTMAIQLIDSEDAKRARVLLQRVIEKQPRNEQAYIELARVAMKTRWSREGRAHAESLLKSALDLNPGNVNAKILLGYVHAHEGRHKEADALFKEAAVSNPPNLWLRANWAELRVMQGRPREAIAKYRELLARPPTGDTNDRARVDAFRRVQPLLQQANDLDVLEAVLQQAIRDYPDMGCFGIDYASFLVLQREDGNGALAVLEKTPVGPCDATRGRETRGLAHYVRWSKEPARTELLHQARAFMPVSPRLLMKLASGAGSAKVVQRLTAAGENIGRQDESGFDALAYALSDGNVAAAERLLKAGARVDATVGPAGMPVPLIAVLTGNHDAIRLMQRSGVDYAKLRFQGTTALDHAKSIGDTKLLELLNPRHGRL